MIDPRHLEKCLEEAKNAGMAREQIARFLRAGYVPQPQQMRFHVAARSADAADGPTKIAMGGDRGGAKSHTAMAQVSIDDCQRYPGLDVLFLRKISKAARKALDQLRAKTFIRIPHSYNRNEGLINFENGSTIVVGHFKDEKDIDKYVGIEYDLIVIEEAGQLSRDKVEQLLGSLRSSKIGWRARSYYTFNPGGIGHQFLRKQFVLPYRAGAETDTKFVPMSWRRNAFVSPEYVEYLNSLSGMLRRLWRDGDFDATAGQFFINWNQERHVIGAFNIPLHWPIWASLDYGFRHPTAVYWHAADEDGNIYTVAEHVQQLALPGQHQRRIHDISEQLLRPVPKLQTFVAGHDAFAQKGDSQGKTVAEQYQEYGIRLRKAKIDRISGAAEMLKRLGNEEEGIAPSWFIFDTCRRLIECIPMMEADPNRPEDVLKLDADSKGENGDDPYDAARYGLMERPVRTAGAGVIRSR